MLSRKLGFFYIIRRRILYTEYRPKHLYILKIVNMSIPYMDTNVFSKPHVDKVSIPHMEKSFFLYEQKVSDDIW